MFATSGTTSAPLRTPTTSSLHGLLRINDIGPELQII
jgi:hypothetical protein